MVLSYDAWQARDFGMRTSGVLSISGSGRSADFVRELRARPDIVAAADVRRAPWFGRLGETMVIPAGAFWPGEDPIGKTIRAVESRDWWVENLPDRGDMRVIGVAKDVSHGGVFEGNDHTCLYVPSGQAGFLLALVRGDEDAALLRLRQWMLERYPAFEAETLPLSAVLNMSIYPFRAATWIGWILGLLAMALTVSGMYGVMSYLVNQRSKEIGIRMALGSSPSGVVALVMKRSVWLAGIGVVVGGGFAAVAMRLLVVMSAEAQIVEWDTVALLAGVLLAGAAGVLAALGPSSRAARVDPNSVLRAD